MFLDEFGPGWSMRRRIGTRRTPGADSLPDPHRRSSSKRILHVRRLSQYARQSLLEHCEQGVARKISFGAAPGQPCSHVRSSRSTARHLGFGTRGQHLPERRAQNCRRQFIANHLVRRFPHFHHAHNAGAVVFFQILVHLNLGLIFVDELNRSSTGSISSRSSFMATYWECARTG